MNDEKTCEACNQTYIVGCETKDGVHLCMDCALEQGEVEIQ